MSTTEMRTAALFTATDRCDRCAAQATTRAVLLSGGELVFCDHHLRRYRPALTPLTARYEQHVVPDEAQVFVPSPAGR
ncbi:hypothetical protein [Actinophytocola sp. NPDC049390]|uniref:DUF7455 domain-containing protein n=1 Tax=Actinophytocola sp. NPDC049390 TaxID=3363894 RepID=UPI00378980E6